MRFKPYGLSFRGKKRSFSTQFGPVVAVLPPRVQPFSKTKPLTPSEARPYSPHGWAKDPGWRPVMPAGRRGLCILGKATRHVASFVQTCLCILGEGGNPFRQKGFPPSPRPPSTFLKRLFGGTGWVFEVCCCRENSARIPGGVRRWLPSAYGVGQTLHKGQGQTCRAGGAISCKAATRFETRRASSVFSSSLLGLRAV